MRNTSRNGFKRAQEILRRANILNLEYELITTVRNQRIAFSNSDISLLPIYPVMHGGMHQAAAIDWSMHALSKGNACGAYLLVT